MEDSKIIDLYFARSETAISETQKKYAPYCHTIAYNILYSNEDAEECVNDTYLRAWQAMPPHRPSRLSSFLGRITRNLALDRYNQKNAQKRGGSIELVLDEISECLPDTHGDDSNDKALKDAINSFLASLPKRTRIIFMQRYWYLSSISEISHSLGISESNVKVILMRTRKKFKAHLEKEEIFI
ncbi:MAG: sigma-70 family RNA polymerase sigma factor [Ruminococcaceae bacterium]|nr:sigma-70 family RNA polymerase sigma factor [Oscillospiraceae bacterium]